jgi:hypothetical protein
MPAGLTLSFSAVPSDTDGTPLLATYDQRSYGLYVSWLADYLYRPWQQRPLLPASSLEDAWSRISAIESEIAFWIWDHPFKDYPPGLRATDPGHADFPHRVELSHVLSRVPDAKERAVLVNRFFQALARDAAK